MQKGGIDQSSKIADGGDLGREARRWGHHGFCFHKSDSLRHDTVTREEARNEGAVVSLLSPRQRAAYYRLKGEERGGGSEEYSIKCEICQEVGDLLTQPYGLTETEAFAVIMWKLDWPWIFGNRSIAFENYRTFRKYHYGTIEDLKALP